MSIKAVDWAFKQSVGNSSAKLVLLALANRSGDECTAWPSQASIAEDTELDRKTIIKSIKTLIEKGLILDTGGRKGSRGNVVVYRLMTDSIVPKTVHKEEANSPKNGTFNSPKYGTETSQEIKENTSGNSAKFGIISGADNDQITVSNSPKNGTINDPKNGTIEISNSPKNGTCNSPKNGTFNSPKFGTRNLSLEPSLEPIVSQQRKTRIPDDFAVTEKMRDWALTESPGINLLDETEHFKDHHIANGNKFIDWERAWKNWIRNSKKFNRNMSNQKQTSFEPPKLKALN
jgi:biotin operon repressor